MIPIYTASEEITVILNSINNGNRERLNVIIPLVYNELRRQAKQFLHGECENHTLQTTALINEAYIRLVEQENNEWENRAHFFGLAGNMMRRILVDYARAKQSEKRGGNNEDIPLDEAFSLMIETTDETKKLDLIMLDEALKKLALIDEQEAQIVELRYFSGLSVDETAEVLGISRSSVKRDWNMAKAWLRREMTPKN